MIIFELEFPASFQMNMRIEPRGKCLRFCLMRPSNDTNESFPALHGHDWNDIHFKSFNSRLNSRAQIVLTGTHEYIH